MDYVGSGSLLAPCDSSCVAGWLEWSAAWLRRYQNPARPRAAGVRGLLVQHRQRCYGQSLFFRFGFASSDSCQSFLLADSDGFHVLSFQPPAVPDMCSFRCFLRIQNYRINLFG